MKKIFLIFAACLACYMPAVYSANDLKSRPFYEQPRYGDVKFSKAGKEANEKFIQTSIQANGTREKAAEMVLQFGNDLYKQSDYSTAMKRFNQAWLLDPENPEVYRGFALILHAWNYDEEAAEWEQVARQKAS